MLSVSVGALPRPAPGEHSCRKGGPLAVTDASLLLGRLIPSYFPKIFGKSESEPLDHEASRRAFEELAERINSDPGIAKRMNLDEIVYGCVASCSSVLVNWLLMHSGAPVLSRSQMKPCVGPSEP